MLFGNQDPGREAFRLGFEFELKALHFLRQPSETWIAVLPASAQAFGHLGIHGPGLLLACAALLAASHQAKHSMSSPIGSDIFIILYSGESPIGSIATDGKASAFFSAM